MDVLVIDHLQLFMLAYFPVLGPPCTTWIARCMFLCGSVRKLLFGNHGARMAELPAASNKRLAPGPRCAINSGPGTCESTRRHFFRLQQVWDHSVHEQPAASLPSEQSYLCRESVGERMSLCVFCSSSDGERTLLCVLWSRIRFFSVFAEIRHLFERQVTDLFDFGLIACCFD